MVRTRESRREARKSEYEANKEKIKERVRRWASDNPDRRRDYARNYARRPDRAAKRREIARKWWQNNPEKSLYSAARRRARRYGQDFDIELSDIVIPANCPILGIPIVVGGDKGRTVPGSPSLDRIDNTKGYIKGNVWVISWRANRMKADASVEDLRLFCEGIIRIFGK